MSLVILRPAAVLVCGLAALTLKWEDVRANRFLFLFAAALFALVTLHLIPLPPGIWHGFPGREFITEIDSSAALGDVWRPASIAPLTTWNALFSLFVPLAALLLAVQLDQQDRHRLLPLIIALGLLSGLLGLLQVVGSSQSPLYLYRITNNGASVGLFANRNHQAVMLASLIPLLAIYASGRGKAHGQPGVAGIRRYLALAAGVVLVPLLLVTGSRAGLALGALGLLSVPLLYRPPERTDSVPKPARSLVLMIVGGSIGVAALVVLTILFGRAEAFSRIMAPDPLADARFGFWGPVVDLAWKYFPFGSGVGTFVEAYQIDESHQLLNPNYLNHAHNDWLEVAVTSGVPGLILLCAAAIAWLTVSLKVWRSPARIERGRNYGRLGSILLLMLALASFGDYPLRVPSLQCLAVIFALWLGGAGGRETATPRAKSVGISDKSPVGGAGDE